jgi:raffinose/stachyose/melibiose transport system substrate-binding protein
VIELVQYKPEAVNAFEQLEEKFNAEHDDIELKIDSPNDAMTILKTRFIREDNPDIIGIGGDINYSNFLDAEMLMDISDFDGLSDIKENYLQTNKDLEYIPMDGVYAVPYVANAAGVLYNKDIFEENGWTIPTTWDEFTALCETIQDAGVLPLYFGYKDTWTTLAPWNAIAVDLCQSDIAYQVNSGNATYADAYREVAVKTKQLLDYAEPNPVAYSYNDACTAFARGQSAMYVIGNYAIPQIKSVNPDMNIGSFVFPASNEADENILNSGNDLMFCVMEDCENKEAAYEVLRFLLEDENIQIYLDDQSAVPCKKGDF